MTEVKPFADPLLNKLEIFNEITLILVLDTLFVFSDEFNNAQKNQAGRIFIFLLGFNIVVQIYHIVRETCREIKLSRKKKKYAKTWARH